MHIKEPLLLIRKSSPLAILNGPLPVREETHCWKGRNKMFHLMTNNTFYLRLYSIGHMAKDHSDSERGNLLPPHRLLFPINSKGSCIYTILQTG